MPPNYRGYIDVETTGLHPKKGATIIEVALAIYDRDFKEIAWHAETCNPGAWALNVPGIEVALNINHITLAEIRKSAPVKNVSYEIANMRRKYLPEAHLHAFNRDFDAAFLARDPWQVGLRAWGNCIMLEAHEIMGPAGALPPKWGGFKWPKLSEAAAFFKVKVVGEAHRALSDVRTTAKIHQAILSQQDTRVTKGA